MNRPKVDPEDYNPNWKDEVIAAYREGKSDLWVRGKCFLDHHISNDLWYRWLDEVDEFSETVKFGKALSQMWWEDASQDHAIGGDGNATTLIFNMTNRFSDEWKQRQTVEQNNKHGFDIKDLEKLTEFLKEHGVDTSNL